MATPTAQAAVQVHRHPLSGVTVDVSGELIKDTDAEMRMAMARQ